MNFGMTDPHTTDFSLLESRTPAQIAEGRDCPSIQSAFATARAARLPVTLRGAGHSCNGLSLSDNGLLLRIFGDAPPIEWESDETLIAPAAASWNDVERAANARGRAVAVLPDYLDLSVGGTLSVGGYGVRSIIHGSQVDLVLRLRLVTPDGRVHDCSRDQDPDLFRFALAGVGGLGAIESAAVRTIPLRRTMRLFAYRHPSFCALAASLDPILAGDRPPPDAFLGAWLRLGPPAAHGILSEYGLDEDPDGAVSPGALPAARPAAVETIHLYPFWSHARRAALIDSLDGHHRLWADWIFPAQSLPAFAQFLDEQMRDPAFSATLRVAYLLGIGRPAGKIDLPFEAASGLPGDGLRFGIGLYHFVRTGDGAAIEQAHRSLDVFSAFALARGARPYLYGRHALPAEARRRLYGPTLLALAALRARHDPDSRLHHPLL